MMKRRLSSGDLMLLELVFAIVFFCLSMAAAMSVFGNAYEMSSVAEDRDISVREISSAAEIIRASDSKEEMGSYLLSEGFATAGNDVYEKTYGDGEYRLVITVTGTGTLYSADMSCYYVKSTASHNTKEAFYDLVVKHSMKGDSEDGR